MRYAGLEVPEDNHKDARLREPHVVAVLSYASDAKVIREALITCDDVKQAALLRSFADETRMLADNGGKSLRLTFTQNYPSPPATGRSGDSDCRGRSGSGACNTAAKMHVAACKR